MQRLVLKKILNHVDDDITGVYDRYSYDAEKQSAMNTWNDRLRRLIKDADLALVKTHIPSSSWTTPSMLSAEKLR